MKGAIQRRSIPCGQAMCCGIFRSRSSSFSRRRPRLITSSYIPPAAGSSFWEVLTGSRRSLGSGFSAHTGPIWWRWIRLKRLISDTESCARAAGSAWCRARRGPRCFYVWEGRADVRLSFFCTVWEGIAPIREIRRMQTASHVTLDPERSEAI